MDLFNKGVGRGQKRRVQSITHTCTCWTLEDFFSIWPDPEYEVEMESVPRGFQPPLNSAQCVWGRTETSSVAVRKWTGCQDGEGGANSLHLLLSRGSQSQGGPEIPKGEEMLVVVQWEEEDLFRGGSRQSVLKIGKRWPWPFFMEGVGRDVLGSHVGVLEVEKSRRPRGVRVIFLGRQYLPHPSPL